MITLDSDRIPVGDGFEYLGGSLTGVTISDGIGFFEVADCPVGNNYNPDGCSESGFRVRVIPTSFNSNQNDTCVGSHAYTTLQNGAATECSLNDGTVSNSLPGSVQTATVSGSSCTNWAVRWSQANSLFYYIGRLTLNNTHVGFLLSGEDFGWSLGNYAHNPAGDTWTISATLVGKGKSATGGFTAQFDISGTATALGANCSGGTRPTQFFTSGLHATAVVTRP